MQKTKCPTLKVVMGERVIFETTNRETIEAAVQSGNFGFPEPSEELTAAIENGDVPAAAIAAAEAYGAAMATLYEYWDAQPDGNQ